MLHTDLAAIANNNVETPIKQEAEDREQPLQTPEELLLATDNERIFQNEPFMSHQSAFSAFLAQLLFLSYNFFIKFP